MDPAKGRLRQARLYQADGFIHQSVPETAVRPSRGRLTHERGNNVVGVVVFEASARGELQVFVGDKAEKLLGCERHVWFLHHPLMEGLRSREVG